MNDRFGSGTVHRNRPGQRMNQEVRDAVAARKVQKADREKLRRDRLNEQFSELGNALDPDRPKNDKATILNDTIQMLKDLSFQVNRLKAEYASLSEESRELTQEKNELKEEKAALKSAIDELNNQYQQRLRVLYPWGTVDTSVVMGPPAYPFPVPVPIPSGPIPIHPMQPYTFFQNLGPGTIANPFSTQMPFPSCDPQREQPSSQHNIQRPNHLDCRSKPSNCQNRSSRDKSDDFSDVATELELKTPGSAASTDPKASHDQDLSSEARNATWWKQQKGSAFTTGSSSSRCSSSCSVSGSSLSGGGDGSVAEN